MNVVITCYERQINFFTPSPHTDVGLISELHKFPTSDNDWILVRNVRTGHFFGKEGAFPEKELYCPVDPFWISSQIYRDPTGIFHFSVSIFSSIFGVPQGAPFSGKSHLTLW